MPVSTNIAFTELIKVNGRLREFNFRKRSDSLYDADTADGRSGRYLFRLKKEESGWKIHGDDLPGWIIDAENLIAGLLR